MDKNAYIRQFFERPLKSDDDYSFLGYLTEPDTVAQVRAVIDRDDRLTDEVKGALTELFSVAYKRFSGDDE